MFSSLLNHVRTQNPIVHHITNYVTVTDCANAVLAIGGSPIMADDLDEVCDIKMCIRDRCHTLDHCSKNYRILSLC